MSGHGSETRARRKNELRVKPERGGEEGVDVRGAPHSIINSRTAVLIHNAGDPGGLGGPRSFLLQHIPAQRLLWPSNMTVSSLKMKGRLSRCVQYAWPVPVLAGASSKQHPQGHVLKYREYAMNRCVITV